MIMDVVLEHSHIWTIARHFGLGDLSAWERLGRVYCLHTDNGAFALRFYNAGVTLAHVQATQAVRLALVEAGLPVGAPIMNAAGESVLEFDGRFVELQPWISHTGYGNSWSGIVAAAAPLGYMHDVMATCHVTSNQRDDPWRGPAELADQLEAERRRQESRRLLGRSSRLRRRWDSPLGWFSTPMKLFFG